MPSSSCGYPLAVAAAAELMASPLRSLLESRWEWKSNTGGVETMTIWGDALVCGVDFGGVRGAASRFGTFGRRSYGCNTVGCTDHAAVAHECLPRCRYLREGALLQGPTQPSAMRRQQILKFDDG